MPEPLSVELLGGGVSNTVLLVRMADWRLVLKQSLAKLRVEQDWFSDPARIFRESEALQLLKPHLPAGSLPDVFFEDRENGCFAMSAAPPEAETWKASLMRGEVRVEIAEIVGRMLAAMIRASWRDAEWEARFGDQTVFDQLRLDPYYRATARAHTDLAPQFVRLMQETAARRVCLVHGDWSPKNFLVSERGTMAIDFEVIHYGDPAFDVAFLWNHLALKAVARPPDKSRYRAAALRFWASLVEGLPAGCGWIEEAAIAHLGALMLARVDGKSPVEYLRADERDRVRGIARGLMLAPPGGIAEAFERL